MSYSNTIGHLQDLISEAHSDRVDESEAKLWAKSHIECLDSYDEVKDLAYHYGIGSVEVAHHQTVRSQLLKKIVEEMLDFESSEDDEWEEEY